MMIRFVRFVQNYLLGALPFVLICMVWGTRYTEVEILKNPKVFTIILWNVLSWNLMLWFAVLIVFLVLLVALPKVREKTLRRLANLQERDEREQYITGKAARAAYISSLSILILLFFLSVFSLKITRFPEGETNNGKHGSVAIGLRFSLLDEAPAEGHSVDQIGIEYTHFPLSKTAVLLGLIVWQLVIFNVSARRENQLHT